MRVMLHQSLDRRALETRAAGASQRHQRLAPSGLIFASLTAGCRVLLHGLISCSTPNEANPIGGVLRRLQMHARCFKRSMLIVGRYGKCLHMQDCRSGSPLPEA
jgi:hypothetical protein